MTRTAALFAACVLFFWMFLAADPLEQLGAGERFRPALPDVREVALSYAALWRHGMAGNSPLYMPGFFAVAVAAWWWAHGTRPARLWLEGSAIGASALAVAVILVVAAGDRVVGSFEQQFAVRLDGVVPRPSALGGLLAAYTLATWTIFVVCCRRALERRSWRPFWPVPPMTLVLMAVRTWTLDDVQDIWAARFWNGDPAAVVSALAIPIVAGLMWRSGLTSSRRREAALAPPAPSSRRKSAPPRRSAQLR